MSYYHCRSCSRTVMVQLDVLQLAVGTPGRTQADIIITHSHHLADQIGIHQQVIARHTPRFHRHYMSTLGKFLIDHLHCKLIYFLLLIHTFLSHQLRFLGHLLHSDHALYALYEPTHGKTRRRRPRTNYITYILFNNRTSTVRTHRVSTEPGRLASTCGRVCRPTATRLEEEAAAVVVAAI